MALVSRFHGWAALIAAASLLSACGGTNVDGGPPDGSVANQCKQDQDCPAPNLFQCLNFECVPTCRTKSDCTNATRGEEFKLAQCQGALGCQCEDFKCVGALCSADADCGAGSACRNGQCTTAPAAATVAKCQITPDPVIAKQGTNVKFYVSAWTASNEPVVVNSGITWSALGGVTTLSGSATESSATFTMGAPTAGTSYAVSVQAAIGSTICQAGTRILPTLGASDWRAVVTDELTGRPVDGATLVVSNPTTGAKIGADVPVAQGVATFTATGPVTVTVFHPDYTYVTLANYGASSRDLSFVLRRNQTDKTGGYKGTFTGVPQSSNVHVGLAGMSLAGSVTDLSVQQLLGQTIPTDIKIGTVVDQKGVPLPAGVYLGFADNKVKESVSAQGLAGTCSAAIGNDFDVRMGAGTCGTRTAWGLSGDVPLGEIADLIPSSGSVAGLDFAKVLAKVQPLLKRFTSSVKRDVEFTLKAPAADGGYDVSEYTTVDQAFDGVPLGFGFVVRSPELPQYKGAYLDGVVLLGGVNQQGRGVVPLGLGVGINTAMPLDAFTDPQGTLDKGLMPMRMAPAHHGLEGSEYSITALATSVKGFSDSTAGFVASGLHQRLAGNKLAFDPNGSTPVALTGPYLNLPENARYNFTDAAIPGIAQGRHFVFTTAPTLTGATVVRVLFTDDADRRWVVLMNPADMASGFTLPAPPMGLPDRTFALNNTTGARSNMAVHVLKLNSAPAANGAALTFASLVEHNDTNADRLLDFTQAFSLVDYGRPGVSFVSPTAGATVPKNTEITVQVDRFKIGKTPADDGVVRLTITGGSAQCTPATPIEGSTDASQGKGQIAITLPTDCTGNVTLRAQLYDQTNTTEIKPVVAREITATIQ